MFVLCQYFFVGCMCVSWEDVVVVDFCLLIIDMQNWCIIDCYFEEVGMWFCVRMEFNFIVVFFFYVFFGEWVIILFVGVIEVFGYQNKVCVIELDCLEFGYFVGIVIVLCDFVILFVCVFFGVVKLIVDKQQLVIF